MAGRRPAADLHQHRRHRIRGLVAVGTLQTRQRCAAGRLHGGVRDTVTHRGRTAEDDDRRRVQPGDLGRGGRRQRRRVRQQQRAAGDRGQRSTGERVGKRRAGGQVDVRRAVRIGVLRDRGGGRESVGALPAHDGRPVRGDLLRDGVAERGGAAEQGDARRLAADRSRPRLRRQRAARGQQQAERRGARRRPSRRPRRGTSTRSPATACCSPAARSASPSRRSRRRSRTCRRRPLG